MAPLSYEGRENYIFVSYAHKDSDKVIGVLDKMVQAGYRIWYDDGIAPGSEWPENIAQHLDGCAVFVSFISANAIASSNCRREITFAMSREKPFLAVLLEPTQMSLGMEMQLSAHQCILRYNCRSESDFIEKIFSCPDLDCCKIQPPQGQPVPEKQPEISPRENSPQAEEKPVKKEKSAKKQKNGKMKKPLSSRWKAGILTGAAVLLIAFGLLFVQKLPIQITPETKVSRDNKQLHLNDQEITADTVAKINKLKELQILNITDCVIEKDALNQLDLPMVSSFNMKNTPVEDFLFLQNCPALSTLRIENCGVTDENIALAEAPKLRYVNLSGNPQFSDLELLNLSILRELNVNDTGVTDVSPLAQTSNLTKLEAANNAITSIDELAELTELQIIDFSNCGITAVTKPFLSLYMKEVHMSGNGLRTVDGFGNFTVLHNASFAGNSLTDISWLEKSYETLEQVELGGNPLTHSQVQFLQKCVNLAQLDLSGIPLENLDFAVNLSRLKVLEVSRCGLAVLPDLSGLTEVKELMLDGNALTDLTGLPPLWNNSATVLDLSGNKLTDISALPAGNYDVLCLQGNDVEFTDFTDKKGTALFLDYNESLLECTGFDKYFYVYIRDCPADKQLMLEKSVGVLSEFVTDGEMLEALQMNGRIYPQT